MAARLATFLFDLDGTLIDSVDLILASYRHTMLTHRGHAPDDDFWLPGLGTPLTSQFRLVADDEGEIEAMVCTYRAYNLANHDARVCEYPGVRDAVVHLAERGARLGIVTSKLRAGALRGLTLCRYDALFEIVVGSDDVAQHKPDPEPVLKALDLLGAAATSTVFVGDSPHDMAAGKAAGVMTAAALWGPFSRTTLEPLSPDFWLTSPADLATLIDWDR